MFLNLFVFPEEIYVDKFDAERGNLSSILLLLYRGRIESSQHFPDYSSRLV